jgi:hypothetical protein
MAITAFPGGVSSFGIPAVSGALGRYWGGGQVIWVGNRSDLAAGSGESPTDPCSALFGSTGAIAKLNATTSRGHVIFVMPGHAESITGATLTGSGTSTTGSATNGYAVVGLGSNTLRPTFTFSATASKLTVDTADVALDNLRFSNGAADSTLAFDVTGAGCQMRNCYVQASDASNKLTTVLRLSSGANDFIMEDTDIIGGATALTDTCLINAAVARAKFYGVKMIASLGTAEGLITCATAAATNIEIDGSARRRTSIFSNRVAASTVALKFMTAVTGNIDNCLLEVVAGTVADMNGTTLAEPTLAAAINTPATVTIGRNVQVGLATGKYAVLAATITVTQP